MHDFEEFWAAYPKRNGSNPKRPAAKAYQRVISAGVPPSTILIGVRHYSDALRRGGQFGTQYVVHAAKWLQEGRWEDYQQPQKIDRPGARGL